jgi:hypothetical protein
MERGQLMEARRLLFAVLGKKFGTIPEPLRQQVEATAELDRLENALLRVPDLGILDEFHL